MSWSYDVATLADNIKDQIRLRIGDTDESDPVLQDEEIMYYMGESEELTSNILLQCVNACITRISSLPDYKLGPYSESNQARIDAWKAIKEELEANAYSQHAPISEPPTTSPIFSYDFMSRHCCGGGLNE